MITAEKLLKSKETYEDDYPTVSISDAHEAMIEFAKLHVLSALTNASRKVLLGVDLYDYIEETFSSDEWFDKESILNAYPLTNIV